MLFLGKLTCRFFSEFFFDLFVNLFHQCDFIISVWSQTDEQDNFLAFK